jgi:hypothetical protein
MERRCRLDLSKNCSVFDHSRDSYDGPADQRMSHAASGSERDLRLSAFTVAGYWLG